MRQGGIHSVEIQLPSHSLSLSRERLRVRVVILAQAEASDRVLGDAAVSARAVYNVCVRDLRYSFFRFKNLKMGRYVRKKPYIVAALLYFLCLRQSSMPCSLQRSLNFSIKSEESVCRTASSGSSCPNLSFPQEQYVHSTYFEILDALSHYAGLHSSCGNHKTRNNVSKGEYNSLSSMSY